MEVNIGRRKKKNFDDEYTILEELLISKKVKIYKVQSKKDRLTCRMMHSIQKSSFCNLNDDKIMTKEFELLSKLNHPNIIKLIEVIREPNSDIWFVFEFCECNLLKI